MRKQRSSRKQKPTAEVDDDWRPHTFPDQLNWFTSDATVPITLSEFSNQLKGYLQRVGLKIEVTDTLAEKTFQVIRQYIRIDGVLGSAKQLVGTKDWNRLRRVTSMTEKSLRAFISRLKKYRSTSKECTHTQKLIDYILEELARGVEPVFNEIYWYKRLTPLSEQLKRDYQRDHLWSECTYWLYVRAERMLPQLNKSDRELFVAACLIAGKVEKESEQEEGTLVVQRVHQNLHAMRKWLKRSPRLKKESDKSISVPVRHKSRNKSQSR